MGRAAALAGRRVRLAWLLLLSVVAVSLASFTLLVAALSWVEFRNLSRSLQGWGEHGNQHQTGRAAAMEAARSNASTRLGFLQALLNSKAVLRKRRERSRGSGTKHKPSFAAHFEVVPITDDGTYIVEKGGVIRQWAERSIQVRNHPLTYNNTTGDFMVKKEGVYYIYSQVHCDDNTTAYLKLDVKVDNVVAFKCLQGLPPTPAFGQHLPVHSCHASGLLKLRRNARISLASIGGLRIKTRTFTYFGLFRL